MSVKELPVIKIFTSHVCPYCPQATKMLNSLKPQLEGRATIKEYSTLTPKGRSEALKLNILSIPQIAIGDKIVVRGLAKNADDLLTKIEGALREQR